MSVRSRESVYLRWLGRDEIVTTPASHATRALPLSLSPRAPSTDRPTGCHIFFLVGLFLTVPHWWIVRSSRLKRADLALGTLAKNPQTRRCNTHRPNVQVCRSSVSPGGLPKAFYSLDSQTTEGEYQHGKPHRTDLCAKRVSAQHVFHL